MRHEQIQLGREITKEQAPKAKGELIRAEKFGGIIAGLIGVFTERAVILLVGTVFIADSVRRESNMGSSKTRHGFF
ncbi:hypothetical protein M1349_00875 [Patescibacteria group bacterium]|nr:hypothetical protein [Patescibacteria group bacterium]